MSKESKKEFAKYMLQKTDKELENACEAYYQARMSVKHAFEMVKEDGADLMVADALVEASTNYRNALRERQRASINLDCIKESLKNYDFTEEEILGLLCEE